MAEHPLKLVFDTSVYIPFVNKGISHPVLEYGAGRPLLYMSAVVLEELYAGAHDPTSIKLLDKLYDTFIKVHRLIVPDAADWQKAGKVVAQFERKYGFEEKFLARITHDIFIALSARRIGAVIVTKNTKDFHRIQEFIDCKMSE